MEALTRLVTESLARHGLDRPIDPRRLQWSRWFRCDSPHSLLTVPSKPGIFALAEEIMDMGSTSAQVETTASAVPRSEASGPGWVSEAESRKPEAEPRRMLAVFQFSEDDDMAFVLDRMFTRPNPLRERLAKGSCFLRFVVIQDAQQRRSICSALNQWLVSSTEKVTGIGADFASSLELTDHAGRTLPSAGSGQALSATAGSAESPARGRLLELNQNPAHTTAQHLTSGAATNIHCPQPLPSGF